YAASQPAAPAACWPRTTATRSEAVVTLADGSNKTFPLSYQILHRSGDYVGEWYAGLIVDKGGKPILQSAPDARCNVARGSFYSRRLAQNEEPRASGGATRTGKDWG